MASKPKMKIDKEVIQQFFIDHTEKIVMGVLGLCFCYLAYDAFTRPHYEKTVASLQTLVNNAKDRTLKGPSDPNDKPSNKYKIPTFAADIEKQRGLKTPPEVKPLIISPVAQRPPREMPKALPARSIVATSGRGAFAIGNGGNAANGKQIGKHWVVVTGLVPFKEEQENYDKVFKGSVLEDHMRDSPKYGGFFVERVEVDASSNLEPDWSKSKFFYSPSVMVDLDGQFQGGTNPELVDDEFVDPSLTFALPPEVDGKWNKGIAHEPEIPISKKKLEDAAAAPEGPGAAVTPTPSGRGTSRGARVPGVALPTVSGGMPTDGRTGPHVRPQAGGLQNPFDTQAPTGPATPTAVAEVVLPQYKLLRFFDFDVEPSKTYRYRIFLILINPNVGLDAKVLLNVADGNRDNLYIGHDKEQLDDQKAMIVSAEPKTDNMAWSDPTPPVTIPSDQGILAGRIEIPHNANAFEPQGELYPIIWLPDSGDKAFTVIDKAKRAQVVDLQPRTGENGPRNVRIDFTTNDCIVDMRGGELFSAKDKELTAPGQILSMDHDGKLVIHNELDDADTIAKFREKPASAPVPHGRSPEGGQPTTGRGEPARAGKGNIFQP